MSRDALYAWRSRLRRHARRVVDETTASAQPAHCRAFARLEAIVFIRVRSALRPEALISIALNTPNMCSASLLSG